MCISRSRNVARPAIESLCFCFSSSLVVFFLLFFFFLFFASVCVVNRKYRWREKQELLGIDLGEFRLNSPCESRGGVRHRHR